MKEAFTLQARSGWAWLRFMAAILVLLVLGFSIMILTTPTPKAVSDLYAIQGQVSGIAKLPEGGLLIAFADLGNPFWVGGGDMRFLDEVAFNRDVRVGTELSIGITESAAKLFDTPNRRVPALDIRSAAQVYLSFADLAPSRSGDLQLFAYVIPIAMLCLAVLLFFSIRRHDFRNIRDDWMDLVRIYQRDRQN